MLKKSLILCGVFVALVNCSSDKAKTPAQNSISSDTPTEIIDANGKVVDTINPPVVTPTADELTNKAWNDLGFGKTFLMDELIGADVCSLGEKQYVGCFFAAQYLSTAVYGANTMMVFDGQKNPEFIGKKVATIGVFAVHEKVAPDASKADGYTKRENDLFKETIARLVNHYKKNVSSMPEVQTVISKYLKEFPEVLKELQLSVDTKDKVKYAAAQKKLEDLEAIAKDAKSTLELSVFKEYVTLVNEAFTKIPETHEGIEAKNTYAEYLRHSADGHARIDLADVIKQEITGATAETSAIFGIGISIVNTDNGIFMTPLEGGAAQEAGILPNDKLIAVNGQPATDFEAAIAAIKGPRHTEANPSIANVTVEHWDTKKQETFSIKRQPVQQKSYTLVKKNVNGKVHGVLTITTFMDPTMASAVRDYIKANDGAVDGWILDLRNNPGGLLDQAVDLLSAFLPANSATVSESMDDNPDVIDTKSTRFTLLDQVTKKNLVVLINGGSASASEIVSGIIQEYKRGVIMGQRSFGKGTVQRSGYEFHPDIPKYEVWSVFNAVQMTPMGPKELPLINVWKTIGRYFYPSGRTPEWVGVSPDVEVSANPNAPESFMAREQDQIPFSFGNLGDSWVQTRADMMKQIDTCVTAKGEATKTWTSDESKKPFTPNYQMLYAYDSMKCM